MFFLFSDYGFSGPYIGQVETVLWSLSPEKKVIHLMVDAPRNNPKASAYLLAALIRYLPRKVIIFSVIDPGVGMGVDKPVAIHVNNRWFVGPDNGLFDLVCRGKKIDRSLEIIWSPDHLSNSFYGREIYAPVCSMIANDDFSFGKTFPWQDRHNWPDDLRAVIYIDNFGNCMTGIRGETVTKVTEITVGDNKNIFYSRTFGEVLTGDIFWYENSIGLIEIAVNQGNAAEQINGRIGDRVGIMDR